MLPYRQSLLGPVTANPMVARQVATQRAAYPRQQLETPQQALEFGAGITSLVPGIGDAMGLAADLNRYRTEPESRTLPNFGLTGLGLLPFVPGMTSMKKPSTPKPDDYVGAHRPPSPDYGAPLHDLTAGDLIPKDIYSPQAVRYYGTGDARMDEATIRMFNAFRGKPDQMVSIYRAVPKDASGIKAGDWVTINKGYAKLHGEGPMRGDYKIVEQKVRASDLWTSLDSIHEFGYHPKK